MYLMISFLPIFFNDEEIKSGTNKFHEEQMGLYSHYADGAV